MNSPMKQAVTVVLNVSWWRNSDRKDGFEFYLNLVNTCDVLVFGMNIEDRYLKPIWKLFLDRTFSNGHRTSMMGKHTAYLVAGPLRSLPNVRQFLEGKDNVGRENAMCIIGDEYEDSLYLENLLRNSAKRLSQAALAKYQKSINFLGVGGIKIFRDLIYSMRGVVGDDHRFYKKNGLYDFPQEILANRFSILAWAWLSSSNWYACRHLNACQKCTSSFTSKL